MAQRQPVAGSPTWRRYVTTPGGEGGREWRRPREEGVSRAYRSPDRREMALTRNVFVSGCCPARIASTLADETEMASTAGLLSAGVSQRQGRKLDVADQIPQSSGDEPADVKGVVAATP